jgi:ATP-binding cassette subfamily B protein
MEGELVAKGTHEYLLQHSPEYVQIYRSQKSTTNLTAA